MGTDRLSAGGNPLGIYLKDCRARLDPTAFGFSTARRRTPGLRREEVAQRADVSSTWYTWLEQGRGGVPSVDVLDRIASALTLTSVEREYLFLLAQHRPPEIGQEAVGKVTPRLQRVLDALELSPAYVRTSTWDIVAWNRAAAAVLIDYETLPLEERNLLHILFCNPRVRATMPNWESVVRLSVATFRADAARAGASKRVAKLVDSLSRKSPEFEAMWRENEVRTHGEGSKHVFHPTAGRIALEYSSFAVDGQPDLGMVVFSPATSADADRIRLLVRP
ncbi:XRE family transcriptional regulator [bacterium]|nr:MAG: XRE family transcriptional regulator [bacterium]